MRWSVGFMFVVALAALPLLGCGETAAGCEGAMNGTACDDGACMDGDCTALTTVSGTVIVDEVEATDGATVSWFGSILSTTTDESGAFSFEVPVGNLFLQTSKAGTWGYIELIWTEEASELELGLESDAGLAEVFPGVDLDPTKGLVDVDFDNHSGRGGESATISEAYDSSSVEDANGDRVVSNALVPGGYPWLAFENVELTDELTVIPSGAEGVNTCSLQVPGTVYPVAAKSITGVEAVCTPL